MSFNEEKESFDRVSRSLETWENWFLYQTGREDLRVKIKAAYDDLRQINLTIHRAKVNTLEALE